MSLPGGATSPKESEDRKMMVKENKAVIAAMPPPLNLTPVIQPDSEKGPVAPQNRPYSAFSPWRRRLILIVITVAGFFGPLAGGIYLPALPVLEHEFQASATAINVTVSVFMLTFAFGVSTDSAEIAVLFFSNHFFYLPSIATILVKLCGLEGPPASVPNLHCHLYWLKHPASYSSC